MVDIIAEGEYGYLKRLQARTQQGIVKRLQKLKTLMVSFIHIAADEGKGECDIQLETYTREEIGAVAFSLGLDFDFDYDAIVRQDKTTVKVMWLEEHEVVDMIDAASKVLTM
jgi:hypothetical protein